MSMTGRIMRGREACWNCERFDQRGSYVIFLGSVGVLINMFERLG